MEIGAHVWLRSSLSQWGWVPAYISNKEPIEDEHGHVLLVRLTLTDDPALDNYAYASSNPSGVRTSQRMPNGHSPTPGHLPYFETGLHRPHYYSHDRRPDEDLGYPRSSSAINSNSSNNNNRAPVLRTQSSLVSISSNSSSALFHGSFTMTMDVDPEQLKRPDGHNDIKLWNIDSSSSSSLTDTEESEEAASNVNDFINLMHLHEPAILHSLRTHIHQTIVIVILWLPTVQYVHKYRHSVCLL